ncbi:MAG: bifunctional folylpolyglutamate synthase/dihydrofolate synthase [Deltaproteobacteria bacterium]|nr:bifunctional folylpolyglutamate synthase/dihydrofolate synthase [Deltaproteobacteria bacterium]
MIDHPVLAASERFGLRLGLDRIRRFLREFDTPQERYRVVHVGGTNGKGSVCAMVAEILRHQGFRTGLYTSPHLQRVNERIVVDGEEISDDALDALLRRIAALPRDPQDAPGEPEVAEDPLTYFEILTIAAFVHFAEVGVEVAVVEVGMGGRLDATNVVRPAVTAITTVGLDHTELLGPDVASIAGEKAGILKPDVPAVIGGVPAEALRVLRTIAQSRGAPLWVYGQDFHTTRDGAAFTWHGPGGVLSGLEVGMPGFHQVDNAAVAVAVTECLPLDLQCGLEAVREGLLHARMAARLEWVTPDVLVDSAHNADGAVTLAAYLRSRVPHRPRTLLLGCSREKDVHAIAVLLAPQVDRVLTTACAHSRALSPVQVATALEGLSVPVTPAGGVEEALATAQAGDGEIIVAGSVFLAGAVRDLLGAR